MKEWPRDLRERSKYVDSIFGTIAPRYDLLTRLLSFGQDARWKARILRFIPEGDETTRRLDLATGTAALPILFRRTRYRGTIVGLDRNRAMLREGRLKCAESTRIGFVLGDLCRPHFRERSFDAITMAYGLRYLGDLRGSLEDIHRMLKPGGVFVCLDFGLPRNLWYRRLCLGYLLTFGTLWGFLLHRRADTYWHIVESLCAYPGQDAVARLMKEVGFADIRMEEQLGGISAIIRGAK